MVSGPEIELDLAWQQHVGLPGELLRRLVERHREPHRRYHTVGHVVWVIRHVRELVDTDGVEVADRGAVVAAAVFHDAVYEPTAPPRANEVASASLARRELVDHGWSSERAGAVGAMIEVTVDHVAPPDTDTAVLCDADLAILGADPAGYRAYVEQVRVEYAHVPDDAWRTGRAAVLTSFLDRDRIYSTDAGRDRWETHARANLAAEIATLTS